MVVVVLGQESYGDTLYQKVGRLSLCGGDASKREGKTDTKKWQKESGWPGRVE